MSKISTKKRAQLNKRRITAILFMVVFVMIIVANLVIPDRVYAGKEYRSLAQRPELSLKGLLSGSYMEDMETYLTDQFNGHNKLTRIRARVSLMLGMREANGVYKGKDGYLIEKIKEEDQENLEKNMTAMKEFQKDYPTIDMYVALAPNAATVLKDYLPSHVKVLDQKAQFDKISSNLSSDLTVIDLTEALLAHRDEAVYYHTDDHWTTLGARYGYERLIEGMNLDKELSIGYNAYAVSNDFTGSLAGLSGYERGYKEDLYIYNASNDGSYIDVVLHRGDNEEDLPSLYDVEKLESENQYQLFLGGDYPLVSIRTKAKSSEKLLIIKGSYANCLVPFLTSYYREIVMVDPDYYKEHLNKLMEEYKFSKVLFLFDGNSFVTNTTLAGVLPQHD